MKVFVGIFLVALALVAANAVRGNWLSVIGFSVAAISAATLVAIVRNNQRTNRKG